MLSGSVLSFFVNALKISMALIVVIAVNSLMH